jgi:hypothetical protein
MADDRAGLPIAVQTDHLAVHMRPFAFNSDDICSISANFYARLMQEQLMKNVLPATPSYHLLPHLFASPLTHAPLPVAGPGNPPGPPCRNPDPVAAPQNAVDPPARGRMEPMDFPSPMHRPSNCEVPG